jgi:hypothetical protein
VTKYLRIQKEKILISTQRFQRFQFMVVFLHCYESVLRQNIMAARRHRRAKLLTTWQPGCRDRGKGQEQDIPFKGMPSVIHFL